MVIYLTNKMYEWLVLNISVGFSEQLITPGEIIFPWLLLLT